LLGAKPSKEWTMKKALSLAGLVLVLVVLALSMLPPSPLSAQAGCCKTRRVRTDPWRKAPDLTFERCRQLNEEQDGDDLFADNGRVWWDRQCS
jgi:hypothetical protein